ncbi:type IV secretory system conjugative DNA transfer family protein, partial [Mesorhizobium sp. M5C.F.Ca.IN.020.14.1.1]
IELVGLPRRTKVEQIRERDLMMPQEIRQMPERKMILLVEGQRPIFGEKLRFFETQPFKSAEAFSQAHTPEVPQIEYLPVKPVPATTPEYARAGQASEETAFPVTVAAVLKPVTPPVTAPAIVPVQKSDEQASSTAATSHRTVNSTALRSNSKPAKKAFGGGAEGSKDVAVIENKIKAVEDGLKPSAERLKESVAQKIEKVGDKSPTKRRNYLDIFSATVPDPLDLGLE